MRYMISRFRLNALDLSPHYIRDSAWRPLLTVRQ
jgi:hypothetical protein